jgi:hypothetical protein
LLLGASYDSKTWYENTLFLPLDLLVATLAYSGGIVAYLMARQRWQRVLALFIPLFVHLLANTISHSVQRGTLSSSFSVTLALIIWLVLIFSPAVLTGLFRQLGRIRPA